MQFRPIQSSVIHSVGHNGLKFQVQFKSGAIYEYDLPVKHYEAMLAAPSAGKYFRDHVRSHPSKVIRLPGDKA